MNKKVLKTLEFDKIVNKLIDFASTDSGKKRASELHPSYDLPHILEMQTETEDALSRILRHGDLSLSGVHDLRGAIKRLGIGSTLNIVELLHVCSLLDVAKRAKAYDRNETDSEFHDSLSDRFARLEPLTNVSEEIRRCIISEEEIADDASPALKSIRRNIKTTNDKIHQQMASIMNQMNNQNVLQDNFITQRDGRYCLPVRAEAKAQLPGMVHDQSSSGNTYFIEPMAVVKLNNELTELELKEQKEIAKIIANLSNLCAENIEGIKDDIRVCVELDFIFARGKMAKVMNAVKPIFNTDGHINLRKARHPLLNSDHIVPIDVNLGESFDLLVVTGPNTGGKTVSLKTVGLLTLMGQAGLHIPAADRSELGLFEEVYADIGDEQSIEQNLSTFSSHMTNIVTIGEKANERSLLLFDELCAGTDPTEGAALAISILQDFKNRGCKIMATTHYAEIKIYALSTPRVENACCEFDVSTLSPTYRLLIGIPGKSNAFAISSRIGLPDYIIEDAKNRLDSESEAFEDVLTDLEAKRSDIEKARDEALRAQKEVEELKKALSAKQEDMAEKRRRLLEDASQEANQILTQAKELADQTIKDFTKYANENPNLKEMEEKRAKIGQQIKNTGKNLSIGSTTKPANSKPIKVQIGDSVLVHSMNLKGTVSSLPDSKGNLFVQMGILRSQVKLSDLSLLDEEPSKTTSKAKGSIKTTGLNKSSTIRSEINLIGLTVDEALFALDKYLDDAYLAHLEQVRIVHGKGSGALKNAVQSYLKKQKTIKSYRSGVFGEGDAGVTIAEFK